jgi:3-hydroxyacyl-CoA dehydrogenase
MGPLEIHDLNGLDVVMKAGGKTRQSICNDREHSASLKTKVEKGELGIKTGKGWHDYKGQSREALIDAANRKLLRQLALFKMQEKARHLS